jgi:hypothetical protein
VVLQGVLADDEEELITPALVIVVGEVEDDVHQVADVLDTGGVVVQVDDGGGLMGHHGLVEIGVGNCLVRDVRGSVSVGIRGAEGGLSARGGGVALLGGGNGLLLGLLGFGEGGVAASLDLRGGQQLALGGVGGGDLGRGGRPGHCAVAEAAWGGGGGGMRKRSRGGALRVAEAREGSKP